MYNQIILQYSRNYHNIANQLYFKSVNKTVTSDAPSGLQIKTNLIFFHLHLPQPDFFFFFLVHASCGILVSRPGTEPTPFAVEAQSLNHWA